MIYYKAIFVSICKGLGRNTQEDKPVPKNFQNPFQRAVLALLRTSALHWPQFPPWTKRIPEKPRITSWGLSSAASQQPFSELYLEFPIRNVLELQGQYQGSHVLFLFFYEFIYFIYLFLAALGLCCCAQAFSSCGEWGLLLVAVRGLLIAVASLVAEHGLQAPGLQQLWLVGSRAQAQQLWCMHLVALQHVGSSGTRARTRVPCTGRRILNHCATRDAIIFFLITLATIQLSD